LSCETCRFFPIEGRATFTIEASSTITNCVKASSARASHLELSVLAAGMRNLLRCAFRR